MSSATHVLEKVRSDLHLVRDEADPYPAISLPLDVVAENRDAHGTSLRDFLGERLYLRLGRWVERGIESGRRRTTIPRFSAPKRKKDGRGGGPE